MADDNFTVEYPQMSTETDDDVVIITEIGQDLDQAKKTMQMMERSSIDFAKTSHTYSRYLNGEETSTSDSLTLSDIDTWADNPQNNLNNILSINSKIKQFVNKDDIIGKVYESVQIYTNTQYSIKYPEIDASRNKSKIEKTVKPLIDSFNQKIDMRNFINTFTTTSYLEGNCVSYLRTNPKTGMAVIDFYPISCLEISEYNLDGEPVVLFNITKLKNKLKITSRKKKNNKDIFYEKVEEVVKNSYPKEVYDAFKNNEKYAILDPKRVGLVRINNLGGLYGLSPIFKALKPALMLENIDNADDTIVKVRAKKIIHQVLRKEIAGSEYEKQALSEMQYAHNNLISAWKNKTVLVTTPWWVEKIEYISDDTPLTDVETLKSYRSRVFTALGINFVDTEANLNLSNISVKDLIKTINKITESVSDVVNKYYKVLLEEYNVDLALAPTIEIMSSELLSLDMKKSLAEFLYTTLGASFDTVYNVLGVSNANTEFTKRLSEKEKGYDEALAPHENFFNQSSDGKEKVVDKKEDNSKGRPKAKEETKKQQYDKSRTENKGGVK